MSSNSSEPENYSYDEIISRLKVPSSENPADGELVLRPDGSTAVRVRKRKRRSKQLHKEKEIRQHRARVIQVSAAVIILFLSVLTAGVAIIYANSSLFRDGLVRKIAQSTGADTQLEQFRMNPSTANAGSLSLEWPSGNVLKSLVLRRLNAEIFVSSFLGQQMSGEEVLIDEGALVLQTPVPNAAVRNHEVASGLSPFQFKRYRAPKLNVTVGSSAIPALKLHDTQASLYSGLLGERTQLRLNQGQVSIPGWPKFQLDRALLEFNGDETNVINLRLLHETSKSGVCELAGTIAPFSPENRSTLTVQLEAFELSAFLGRSLGRLISGGIESMPAPESNYLSFFPTEHPSPILDLSFRSYPGSHLEVKGFPFLFALAQAIGDNWYEHPIFTANTFGTIHRQDDSVSLRNINFENRARMALRGEISLASNQALSGNLQVGIPVGMITTSTASRLNTIFGPPEDGFRWITLKVGGQVTAPTDNFRELYSAAVTAPQSSPPPAENKGASFEELTRPR
jgi:hypothetical protein